MANPQRGAEVVPLLETYMAINTVSVNRREGKPVSTVIQNYASLGIDFSIRYYGDKLQWNVLQSVNLQWGNSNNSITVSANDICRYNMLTSCFEVLNNNGTVIYKKYTSDISEFGISWDVLQSHQFYLFFGIGLSRQSWSRVAKATKKRQYSTIDELVESLFRVDEFGYGNVDIHSMWDIRILGTFYFTHVLSNKISQYILEPPENPTIVRSNYYWKKDIIKGDYSDFLIESKGKVIKTIPTKVRQAIIYRYYEMLMSTVFFTIYNRGNPVYEPWMLWEMWKWLGAGLPDVDETRIFDISPNWSY